MYNLAREGKLEEEITINPKRSLKLSGTKWFWMKDSSW